MTFSLKIPADRDASQADIVSREHDVVITDAARSLIACSSSSALSLSCLANTLSCSAISSSKTRFSFSNCLNSSSSSSLYSSVAFLFSACSTSARNRSCSRFASLNFSSSSQCQSVPGLSSLLLIVLLLPPFLSAAPLQHLPLCPFYRHHRPLPSSLSRCCLGWPWARGHRSRAGLVRLFCALLRGLLNERDVT